MGKVAWKSILMGVMLTLLAEALYIYGFGVVVTVPNTAVQHLLLQGQKRAITEWPRVRSEAIKKLNPVIARDIKQLLEGVGISVGGMNIRVPERINQEITQRLTRQIDQRLDSYFEQQITPKTFITTHTLRKLVGQELSFRLWVDLYRLPIPVTVHVDT